MNTVLLTEHVHVMKRVRKFQISKPSLLHSAQLLDQTTCYRSILKEEEGAVQKENVPVTLGKYI